jgi:hypothetical protein
MSTSHFSGIEVPPEEEEASWMESEMEKPTEIRTSSNSMFGKRWQVILPLLSQPSVLTETLEETQDKLVLDVLLPSTNDKRKERRRVMIQILDSDDSATKRETHFALLQESYPLLPEVLCDFIAGFVGLHEIDTLKQASIFIPVSTRLQREIQELDGFHPHMRFADLDWMKRTLLRMFHQGTCSPQEKMFFHAVLHQNHLITQTIERELGQTSTRKFAHLARLSSGQLLPRELDMHTFLELYRHLHSLPLLSPLFKSLTEVIPDSSIQTALEEGSPSGLKAFVKASWQRAAHIIFEYSKSLSYSDTRTLLEALCKPLLISTPLSPLWQSFAKLLQQM